MIASLGTRRMEKLKMRLCDQDLRTMLHCLYLNIGAVIVVG